MSIELYRGQRNKEKRDLFRRYKLRAVEDIYKKRFFALFNHQCFKCGITERPQVEIGKPPVLCMDHHLPMKLGGHLVPGNIVSLCRNCNNAKSDKHPSDFYTQDELQRLEPVLKKEEDIFDFEFNYEKWDADRKQYLTELGVDSSLVYEILHDENHPDYMGLPSEHTRVTISVDLDEFL